MTGEVMTELGAETKLTIKLSVRDWIKVSCIISAFVGGPLLGGIYTIGKATANQNARITTNERTIEAHTVMLNEQSHIQLESIRILERIKGQLGIKD